MILLDTHVIIWLRSDNRRLGLQTRREVEHALQENNAAASAISFWEVGMLIRKGRLDLRLDVGAWRQDLLDQGLVEIPVDGRIAARAGLLPNMHGDPADRLVVATALEDHQLVTADRRILEWPGPLRRLDATQ